LSATLERKFGGIADMHLLKGYSSVDDLVAALRSFEGKKRERRFGGLGIGTDEALLGNDVALEPADQVAEEIEHELLPKAAPQLTRR